MSEKLNHKSVGRPRVYARRIRTSFELSVEVLEAVDRARGNERSRALELERVLRQIYGLPPLNALTDDQPS
jgi:hypothetical protein